MRRSSHGRQCEAREISGARTGDKGRVGSYRDIINRE